MGRARSSSFQLQRRMRDLLTNRDVAGLYQFAAEDSNVDAKYAGQKRMVYFAAGYPEPEMFDALVMLGANVNLPPVGTANPLFGRIEAGDLAGVKRLLAAGAEVAQLRERGSRQKDFIIHKLARPSISARSESVRNEMLELLLDAGGWQQLKQPSSTGRTPLDETLNAFTSSRYASAHETRESLERTAKMFEHYLELPQLYELGQDYSKSSLFAPAKDTAHSVLDHPGTWQQWRSVVAHVETRGEVIGKADLLENTNAAGTPWIERAVACYGFGDVVASLNVNGETIGRAELLDANRNPTALFTLLEDRRQLSLLFTPENTCEWSRDDFNAILNAMEDSQRALCSRNIHQLRANADRYQRAQRRSEQEMEVA